MKSKIDLRVPRQGSEAIRSLLDLGESGIASLCDAISTSSPTLKPSWKRAEQISGSIPNASVADLDDILWGAVYPFCDVQHQADLSPEEAYDELTVAIRNLDDWPESYYENWKTFKPSLLRLLAIRTLAIEAKGRDLLKERPNRVMQVRIFSDVRPLYSEDRKTIEAEVLTNTLCVKVAHNGREESAIHLSLDLSDLDELVDQIANAKSKNEIIRKRNQQQGIETLSIERD